MRERPTFPRERFSGRRFRGNVCAPFTPRLVLPSPNGSAIAAAVTTPSSQTDLLAASLRNVTATSRWIAGRGLGTPDRPVTVIAAGERWPDGSLRPALEDLLGAGAVIAALARAAAGPLSPEADAARRCYETAPDEPSAFPRKRRRCSGHRPYRTSWPGCGSWGMRVRVAGMLPSRPAWKSSNAVTSSSLVFITNGP